MSEMEKLRLKALKHLSKSVDVVERMMHTARHSDWSIFEHEDCVDVRNELETMIERIRSVRPNPPKCRLPKD